MIPMAIEPHPGGVTSRRRIAQFPRYAPSSQWHAKIAPPPNLQKAHLPTIRMRRLRRYRPKTTEGKKGATLGTDLRRKLLRRVSMKERTICFRFS